ncbi:hypothetical protein I302_101531 [Kwoniella bestiolae CBS 10118]|uniref:WSC domain-containing protein n=1 Tax=Kwoniella bestiolae CBS 10118 TaxID=1296100 RepID=A0A1B9GCH1_9TREE|nr:hypothetical protein I302_00215 [Kwoniella bestiolae CBS 10118]OCF28726.1 hypothetical protein I302_00215 [Kwoniella bestiolae CBS 10118]
MKSASLLPFLVPSITIFQVSAYTFLGCTDTWRYKPEAHDPKGHYAGGTSAGCATYCSSLGTPYFYNQYNTGQCYCSSASPKANIYTYGAGDQAGCEGSDYEIYATKGPINSMKMEGCYTSVTTSQHPGDKMSTIDACFSACPSAKSVIVSPNPDTNSFDCKCNDKAVIDSTGGGTTTCGPFGWFAYSRSGSKRRMEGKRRLEKQLIFDNEDEGQDEDVMDVLNSQTSLAPEVVEEEEC